jgi:hypothetical protein
VKSFTIENGYKRNKYPIKSKESGNTYEVEIYPYRAEDSRYLEGCIVTLYSKKWIFKTQLRQSQFDNNDGKISISYFSHTSTNTEVDYNLVNMTKLIVQLYEKSIENQIKTRKQLEKDFNDFKEWNGEV